MNHALQYLLLMMGLNNATSIYSCLWCTVSKDEIWCIYTYSNMCSCPSTEKDILTPTCI